MPPFFSPRVMVFENPSKTHATFNRVELTILFAPFLPGTKMETFRKGTTPFLYVPVRNRRQEKEVFSVVENPYTTRLSPRPVSGASWSFQKKAKTPPRPMNNFQAPVLFFLR